LIAVASVGDILMRPDDIHSGLVDGEDITVGQAMSVGRMLFDQGFNLLGEGRELSQCSRDWKTARASIQRVIVEGSATSLPSAQEQRRFRQRAFERFKVSNGGGAGRPPRGPPHVFRTLVPKAEADAAQMEAKDARIRELEDEIKKARAAEDMERRKKRKLVQDCSRLRKRWEADRSTLVAAAARASPAAERDSDFLETQPNSPVDCRGPVEHLLSSGLSANAIARHFHRIGDAFAQAMGVEGANLPAPSRTSVSRVHKGVCAEGYYFIARALVDSMRAKRELTDDERAGLVRATCLAFDGGSPGHVSVMTWTLLFHTYDGTVSASAMEVPARQFVKKTGRAVAEEFIENLGVAADAWAFVHGEDAADKLFGAGVRGNDAGVVLARDIDATMSDHAADTHTFHAALEDITGKKMAPLKDFDHKVDQSARKTADVVDEVTRKLVEARVLPDPPRYKGTTTKAEMVAFFMSSVLHPQGCDFSRYFSSVTDAALTVEGTGPDGAPGGCEDALRQYQRGGVGMMNPQVTRFRSFSHNAAYILNNHDQLLKQVRLVAAQGKSTKERERERFLVEVANARDLQGACPYLLQLMCAAVMDCYFAAPALQAKRKRDGSVFTAADGEDALVPLLACLKQVKDSDDAARALVAGTLKTPRGPSTLPVHAKTPESVRGMVEAMERACTGISPYHMWKPRAALVAMIRADAGERHERMQKFMTQFPDADVPREVKERVAGSNDVSESAVGRLSNSRRRQNTTVGVVNKLAAFQAARVNDVLELRKNVEEGVAEGLAELRATWGRDDSFLSRSSTLTRLASQRRGDFLATLDERNARLRDAELEQLRNTLLALFVFVTADDERENVKLVGLRDAQLARGGRVSYQLRASGGVRAGVDGLVEWAVRLGMEEERAEKYKTQPRMYKIDDLLDVVFEAGVSNMVGWRVTWDVRDELLAALRWLQGRAGTEKIILHRDGALTSVDGVTFSGIGGMGEGPSAEVSGSGEVWGLGRALKPLALMGNWRGVTLGTCQAAAAGPDQSQTPSANGRLPRCGTAAKPGAARATGRGGGGGDLQAPTVHMPGWGVVQVGTTIPLPWLVLCNLCIAAAGMCPDTVIVDTRFFPIGAHSIGVRMSLSQATLRLVTCQTMGECPPGTYGGLHGRWASECVVTAMQ